MEVLFPGSTRVTRSFPTEFVDLPARVATAVGPATVTAYPVEHASGAPSYALRVECDGRVIAYSGDTQWTESLVEVSRDADLFVCEALFFDKKVRYHLDYVTVREQRSRFGCRRLILTHLGPDMLGRIGQCEIECAADGQVVAL
jgi:ribonuclease BN (tRNA processing enzyme)